MKISKGVTFVCGNGGDITLSTDREDMEVCGIENGYVFFEDVYINSHNDMLIDMEDGNTVTTIEDGDGNTVVEFGLTSEVPSGKATFQFAKLASNEWYRLKFNDELANTESGNAHGKSSSNGILIFEDVIIENE